MALLCWGNKTMTPLQRRTMRLVGGVMLLTVVTNFSMPNMPNLLTDAFPPLQRLLLAESHAPEWVVYLIAAITALPILLAILILGRYLAAEPDEFIRGLVTRATLWGFALAMVGTAFATALMNIYNHPFPLTLLDADLLIIGGGISFRILQWRYR